MKKFKKCPMCTTEWDNRDEFIADSALVLEGYQANFDYLEMGLFYFTHEVDGCHSTMALQAGDFFDLNPAKPAAERKTLSEDCPTYCLHRDNLQSCPAECECAFVRDILGILQQMKTDKAKQRVIKNKEKRVK